MGAHATATDGCAAVGPSPYPHCSANSPKTQTSSTAVRHCRPSCLLRTCLLMHVMFASHFLGSPGRRTYTVTALPTCKSDADNATPHHTRVRIHQTSNTTCYGRAKSVLYEDATERQCECCCPCGHNEQEKFIRELHTPARTSSCYTMSVSATVVGLPPVLLRHGTLTTCAFVTMMCFSTSSTNAEPVAERWGHFCQGCA